MDFAERLSLWLSAFDAIGLQATHRSMRASRDAAPASPSPDALAAAADAAARFVRAHQAFIDAIGREAVALADDDTGDANYSRYQHRHSVLQRQMQQMIAPLRSDVRQAMSPVSAPLNELALLDAALERLLAPRETSLLPTLPGLMAGRFEQLRQAQEPGWQQTFAQDWREALLAELEVRLAPVAGLVDALRNELKKQA